MSDNITQRNKLDAADQEIKDLKLANSILTNSVTIFNERLDDQEKNILQYLDELNEEVIEIKAGIQTSSMVECTPK